MRTLTPTNCEADDVLPSPHELAQLVFTAATQGDLVPHLRRHWAVR